MSDPLQVYLHDHLAGSSFAIELLESLKNQSADHELTEFVASLLVEIKADAATLEAIIDRVGRTAFDLKSAIAWLTEKASRLKLRPGDPGQLGTFEALETLSLGILGKAALWSVLPVIMESDARIPDLNFPELCAKAHLQFSRVEALRLQTARTAFNSRP